MEPFVKHTGLVVPMDRVNVDTDQIMPKNFLKRVERTGFGQFLFFDWRFMPDGRPNREFELNMPRYQGASILLARDNFGCGSSREHAPWGLQDYGFRVLIAPSFADIFYNNCFKNGMLPLRLEAATVAEFFRRTFANPGYTLTVDLEQRTISDALGLHLPFQLDDYQRELLLNGLDDIGLTLKYEDKIREFEQRRLAGRA